MKSFSQSQATSHDFSTSHIISKPVSHVPNSSKQSIPCSLSQTKLNESPSDSSKSNLYASSSGSSKPLPKTRLSLSHSSKSHSSPSSLSVPSSNSSSLFYASSKSHSLTSQKSKLNPSKSHVLPLQSDFLTSHSSQLPNSFTSTSKSFIQSCKSVTATCSGISNSSSSSSCHLYPPLSQKSMSFSDLPTPHSEQSSNVVKPAPILSSLLNQHNPLPLSLSPDKHSPPPPDLNLPSDKYSLPPPNHTFNLPHLSNHSLQALPPEGSLSPVIPLQNIKHTFTSEHGSPSTPFIISASPCKSQEKLWIPQHNLTFADKEMIESRNSC